MDVSICVVASHKPTDALLMNTHKYNENALNGREREKIKARATIERNSNAMIVWLERALLHVNFKFFDKNYIVRWVVDVELTAKLWV